MALPETHTGNILYPEKFRKGLSSGNSKYSLFIADNNPTLRRKPMPTVVITRDAVSVTLSSRHLEITGKSENGIEKDTKMNIPLCEIERVVVCGSPSVTFSVIHRLMKLNIPVVFLSAGGRWLGELDSGSSVNSARRIRQYELFSDTRLRNGVAVRIIAAKVHNSRRALQRLSAARKQSVLPKQRAASEFLRQLRGKLQRNKDMPLDSIRGLEGIAAAR